MATAAELTDGYSFLVPLVADLMWRNRPGVDPIDETDVAAAFPRAVARMGRSVIAPELRDLSDVDRAYLLAVARQSPPAATAVVTAALGVSKGYAQTYRARLIARGLLEAVGRGKVEFTTPGMRQYILDHAQPTTG